MACRYEWDGTSFIEEHEATSCEGATPDADSKDLRSDPWRQRLS
jgi:hypothetical protein